MSSKLIYLPNTTQIPNIIIDYWMGVLSETQFKVLLVIARKTLGWHKKKDKISKSQIEELTGFKRDAIRRAIRDLEELQLIKSFSNKSKEGDSDPNSYQLNILEIKKEIGGSARKPGGGSARKPRVGALESPTKPKTKPTTTKGIVSGGDESLPFSSEEEEIAEKTKFPLKKEQKIYFDQMKDLDLETDDSTLMIIIRKCFKENRVKFLENAISHMKHEIEKSTMFQKKKIAFFRTILNGKISPISENAKENKKFAEKAKEKGQWLSLEIHEKFAFCHLIQKEIPFDRPQDEFKKLLQQSFSLSKQYAQ